jgi:hypothetical protein
MTPLPKHITAKYHFFKKSESLLVKIDTNLQEEAETSLPMDWPHISSRNNAKVDEWTYPFMGEYRDHAR